MLTLTVPAGFMGSLQYHSNKQRLKAKYGFYETEKIILISGRVNLRKGVFDLVKAIEVTTSKRKDKNLRLVIAGGGTMRELLEGIKKYWSRITITGALDKKTLFDFYQMADIGVVPSYVEQCSYTCIEMMNFGLPLIIADVDGLKELVPNDCGLKVRLVLSKKKAYIDIKQLGEKINYYLDNPDSARKYASNAQRHASLNFSIKEMGQATVTLYEKLLAENQPTREDVGNQVYPLVSIVLFCDNSKNHLRECIESIINQTYSKFELLVFYSNPADQTCYVAKSFNDNRIVLIESETPGFFLNILKEGLKIANGKYISVIDSCNSISPDRLKKQVNFLETQDNTNTAVVGSYTYIVNQTSQVIDLKQYPITNLEIKILFFFQNPLSYSSAMMRTNALKNSNFLNKNYAFDDYSFWVNLAERHQIANIPHYLTRIRHSIVSQNKTQYRESVAEFLSKTLDDIEINHTSEELAIHIALFFDYGKKYFCTPQKILSLNQWVEKVLKRLQAKHNFSNAFLKQTHQSIIQKTLSN